MTNKAKGKEALKDRRERALVRRREELHKWIIGSPIGIMGVNESEQKEKIDRATQDVDCLEKKIGRIPQGG